jgi:hypothetical protein
MIRPTMLARKPCMPAFMSLGTALDRLAASQPTAIASAVSQ